MSTELLKACKLAFGYLATDNVNVKERDYKFVQSAIRKAEASHDNSTAEELDSLHDELHKIIQCSQLGWPEGENSRAHQLLYKIKSLASPSSAASPAKEQCKIMGGSSRMCERGTKSCEVVHSATPSAPHPHTGSDSKDLGSETPRTQTASISKDLRDTLGEKRYAIEWRDNEGIWRSHSGFYLDYNFAKCAWDAARKASDREGGGIYDLSWRLATYQLTRSEPLTPSDGKGQTASVLEAQAKAARFISNGPDIPSVPAASPWIREDTEKSLGDK